jgi:hypothetical protein
VRRRIGARGARAYPILVEKILAHDERLPPRWPVEGTTGYDFLNDAEQLFIDASGCRAIEEAWSALAAGAAISRRWRSRRSGGCCGKRSRPTCAGSAHCSLGPNRRGRSRHRRR